MEFLQKQWVRAIGAVVMIVYSLLSIGWISFLVRKEVLRPPNQVVNPTMDGFAMLGFLFILGSIVASGALAIYTAYKMRGIFKILYVTGTLVVVFFLSFFPLIEWLSPSVDFSPYISDEEILTGKWMDDHYQLELFPNSTFVLILDSSAYAKSDRQQFEGSWKLEENLIHFSDIDYRWDNPCKVTKSEEKYFITYYLPVDLDAWSGNLGLMRETEWLESQ